MNRLQVGTTMCQHLFSVSAPTCIFTQPVLCPKMPDLYKFYNNLNATYRTIETRTKSVRLLQRQYIDRQIKLAQKFCSATEDKKNNVFANKSVREQFHGVIEQNKERLRETEQKLRARGVFILNDIKETKDKMKEKMEGVIEKENIYTIPNLLCIARITASPFLGYLIIEQDYRFAFGMLVVAGVTDLMDGWIARTWKSQSSNLGSFLDPMADKVLVATLFLSLTYCELIPVALTGLIIVRDSLLVLAGFVIRYRSLPPPRTLSRYFDVSHATANLKPTFISKCNTAVQLVLVASTLAAPVFDYVDHPALQSLWLITGFTTVASALSYVFSKNTYTFLKDRKT